MAFLWCRPLRRLPRSPATNRNISSGNEIPSLSLYFVWRHGTNCEGGVGRRQRDDWCFMWVNAYCDWVMVRRNSGGKRSEKWGKLSVCSNSRQWIEIRVVRYKWWVACRRIKPGWVTVQNRLIYLSRINSVSISFCLPSTAHAVAIRSFAPRLLVTSIIYWRRSAAIISAESLSRLIKLNYCIKFTFISVLRRSESVLWCASRESTVSK